MLRDLVPRPLRRAAGRARATLVESEIGAELQRLAKSDRPILAGPWLGEVGFEVLYWIPWLQWVVETFDIPPSRLIAISRGGPSSWYQAVAGRYLDVFDYFTIDEFRVGNQHRRVEVGEQKQLRQAQFERRILAAVRQEASLATAECLHPSLMYRLFQPYWWKHATSEWVLNRARYARLPAPSLPASLQATPGEYVAVKFYFNDCMADDDRSGGFASQVIKTIAASVPVVSLNTGLALDDHVGAGAELGGRVASIVDIVTPRNNLAVQTAVLANARAFVGTYGGFSYLPPFHRVPTFAVYQNAAGFDRSHLEMAWRAFEQIGAATFTAADISTLQVDEFAHRVASQSA